MSLVEPAVLQRLGHYHVAVEVTEGSKTLGRSVIDTRGRAPPLAEAPNVTVALAADGALFRRALLQTLALPTPGAQLLGAQQLQRADDEEHEVVHIST